jgi:murein DD-endopeptidase MepM/ murein hydrolase activator NlpD
MKTKQLTFRRSLIYLLMMTLMLANLPVLQAQRQMPERGKRPVVRDDEEQANPSDLLYRTVPRGKSAELVQIGEDTQDTVETNPSIVEMDGLPSKRSHESGKHHWNTEAGQSAFAHEHGLEEAEASNRAQLNVMFNGVDVCTVPNITYEGSGCCNYGIRDQYNNRDVVYRQPYRVFTSGTEAQRETAARNFADTVHASMPFYLPYKSSHVYAGHGWFYNSGTFHGAVDYVRDDYSAGNDPTFKVYSVAPGRVVSVVWDDWSGNIVVIEHVAPNGDRYRSAYKHLRNGFDHDLAEARAIPKGDKFDGDGNVKRQYKYYLFAHKDDPSTLHWGTNAQTIQVEVGDYVQAGQLIGWSGNTGPGGAGAGLDSNGNPTNSTTANNHLHFMMTVPDPRPGFENDWVQIDPYGVYSEVDKGCYDLLDTAAYERLFAPFYSNFHNVPANVVAKYFGYYPGMGRALQTISLHRDGNTLLCSGSFQSGLSSQWKARTYMTSAEFQQWFDTYHDQGYRPREISVTPDSNGNPRFNVIWKKRNGEGYYTYFGLTDAQWQQKWNEHVEQGGMVVEEHVAYESNNAARHAAVFISSPKVAFYEYHYMSSPVFNTTFDVLNNAGFRMTNMDVAEVNGGRTYGGIWRKVSGAWTARYGMTTQEYQNYFEDYAAQGFRLYRIQGYADSSRFAAIWTK